MVHRRREQLGGSACMTDHAWKYPRFRLHSCRSELDQRLEKIRHGTAPPRGMPELFPLFMGLPVSAQVEELNPAQVGRTVGPCLGIKRGHVHAPRWRTSSGRLQYAQSCPGSGGDAIKGPDARLKHVVRRVWSCPHCGRQLWTAGDVVNQACICGSREQPPRTVWMRLVDEPTSRRLPYSVQAAMPTQQTPPEVSNARPPLA